MPPNTSIINDAMSELGHTFEPKSNIESITRSIAYYGLDQVDPVKHAQLVDAAVEAAHEIMTLMGPGLFNGDAAVKALLENSHVKKMLFVVSRLPVFSDEMAVTFKEDLIVLGMLKQIKYFHALPMSSFAIALARLSEARLGGGTTGKPYNAFVDIVIASPNSKERLDALCENGLNLNEKIRAEYKNNADHLEQADPHAVYPTSIFRQCNGNTCATPDASIIEAVMSTSITTTIRIEHGVLNPENRLLYHVYKPLGRAVAIIDSKVEKYFGADLDHYFSTNGIDLQKLVYGGDEADKDIDNVEKILVDLKSSGVARNEPVLVVGGGVIADIGGFACALYHRNTPYVMLCTSIVSGIDAGPSPRTCCDGYGYKNLYGAYHPPVLTLTDRQFFRTLHPGWLRHGIAEIIKMACVKDYSLFCLLEDVGIKLVTDKFGVMGDETDPELARKCDLIIGKAMEGYVRSEYGNLWETHQCRPHAFGHTWSPGYELPAGMLHGHAVATCMGYGAYLSYLEGWISKDEMDRVHNLISKMELSLWHPIMDDIDLIYSSQVKIVDKRGGSLCAPVPKTLGQCGYIQHLSKERLTQTMAEYKAICGTFPRGGIGVEVHCHEVGLKDPSIVAKKHVRVADHVNIPVSQPFNETNGEGSYNEWIEKAQSKRAGAHNERLGLDGDATRLTLTAEPPAFEADTIFKETVEDYATQLTTAASPDVARIASETSEESMFLPCMVGQLEGQFLKMFVQMAKSKTVLDIGTFTGYSALSFAEGLPADGSVLTIENDEKIAAVAKRCFDASAQASKIDLRVGSAPAIMEDLSSSGRKFDIVFIDADKDNYATYYKLAMDGGLLADDGCILADNSLCALVYEEGDIRRQRLHEFNMMVANDDRVEQTVLTVREGITVIRKKL
eukprot:CAMPEP_0196141822 /NCGR_PEP_ID=MMETSP0910-20130528/10657_1 /TAXON_ID=49265 /ORGANISM="Thalassiosira rotula, Strain GSO102" /LENGTH=899 /DNA_ID=CAMNT_0041403049 /DNA_START=24 /DNA_END=2723 /DNA_ORIENTATION=-